MKIFSTFNTNFKKEILEEEKSKFGDNVLLISHGRIFYYLAIIFPAFFILFCMILFILILIYVADALKVSSFYYYIFGFIFFILIFFPLILKLFKKYIDYILDFIIVTPKSLIYYNQEGVLSRTGITLSADKIKTISVNKEGLFKSMFNYGSLVIFTEGDDDQGEIVFSFVDAPEKIKSKIIDIIKLK